MFYRFVLGLGLAVTMALTPAAVKADEVLLRPYSAPEIASGTWVQGPIQRIRADRGKVIVLLFFTRSCINCKHCLPFWNDWARHYRHSNVEIIGVHTPEVASERDTFALRRFVHSQRLLFPVVTDNEAITWNSYYIGGWPTEILIDKHGNVRHQFEGELNYHGSGEYRHVADLIEDLRREP